jgi:hypothetical protein
MKVPSLSLESKVLLTTLAICIFGILRMTHAINLSEQDEISSLFIIGFVLSAILFSSGRRSSRKTLVFLLCWGLLSWRPMLPSKSYMDDFFKVVTPVMFGLAILYYSFLAIKEYLKSKQNKMHDVEANN